ncbi:MAG: putative NAD(P)H nitroreductase YdjA [Alphaproteobacteria bacterium MarineAlpha12_Bin1]|nr:MAG: putative NAD(P)H nitroreductase YdjA [Alphaproteobacteria bacterium MarineAlpha12_Bin1]
MSNDRASELLNRQSIPPRLVGDPGPTDDDIKYMLDAAVRAPDHGAIRPWRFHVIQKQALNRLGQIFAEALHRRDKEVSNEALEKERRRPLRAPLIITVCAKIDLERVDKIPIVEQVVSAGTACQNILLAAHERGYGAMMLTGANAHDPYVKRAFGLNDSDEIVSFIYIGTPSSSYIEKERPNAQDFTKYW